MEWSLTITPKLCGNPSFSFHTFLNLLFGQTWIPWVYLLNWPKTDFNFSSNFWACFTKALLIACYPIRPYLIFTTLP